MIELHTEQDLARFEYRVLLDQKTYTIRFDWNDRDESWYFNLQDENNDYLVVGQRISVSAAMIRDKSLPNMPQGTLLCYDTTLSMEDPGFADLGDRCKIYYFSPGEL